MTEEDRITVRNVEEYMKTALEMIEGKLEKSYPEVIIVEHADLDTLVQVLGGPDNIPEGCKIYTDDDYTRWKSKYNYIAFPNDHPSLDEEDGYGTVTQIHLSAAEFNSFIDLTDPNFTKYRGNLFQRGEEPQTEYCHIEIDEGYERTSG